MSILDARRFPGQIRSCDCLEPECPFCEGSGWVVDLSPAEADDVDPVSEADRAYWAEVTRLEDEYVIDEDLFDRDAAMAEFMDRYESGLSAA